MRPLRETSEANGTESRAPGVPQFGSSKGRRIGQWQVVRYILVSVQVQFPPLFPSLPTSVRLPFIGALRQVGRVTSPAVSVMQAGPAAVRDKCYSHSKAAKTQTVRNLVENARSVFSNKYRDDEMNRARE